MKMESNEIKELAKSAKLAYTDADIADWKNQLEGVFAWIDKLQEVDTGGVTLKPSSKETVLRADEVKSFDNTPQLVKDFKESEDNMAKVKKVL